MKLLIIGHGRHGKDSLAEFYRKNYDFKFMSSSEAAAKIFIYDYLKEKYDYSSYEECYNDRINHRAEWYNLIKGYNSNDRCKLAKSILEIADCYVGMREVEEILECKRQKLFDYIIWVDASERLSKEPADSFNITEDLADIIIYNNGTEEEFYKSADNLWKLLNKDYFYFKSDDNIEFVHDHILKFQLLYFIMHHNIEDTTDFIIACVKIAKLYPSKPILDIYKEAFECIQSGTFY